LAIRHEPGVAAVVVTIAPDSVITLRDEVEEAGFVDVYYDSQVVKVLCATLKKKRTESKRKHGNRALAQLEYRQPKLFCDDQILRRRARGGARLRFSAFISFATTPFRLQSTESLHGPLHVKPMPGIFF
jgi:hypothetical protein